MKKFKVGWTNNEARVVASVYIFFDNKKMTAILELFLFAGGMTMIVCFMKRMCDEEEVYE